MIEFGGTIYYIDLGALDKALAPAGIKPNDIVKTNEKKIIKDGDGNITSIEEYESSALRGKEIDAAKFEVIRTMIEVILDYEDESDASLGSERALETTPLSYKLAFNTLYNYGIIKEKE
jgi:hypothetical protein